VEFIPETLPYETLDAVNANNAYEAVASGLKFSAKDAVVAKSEYDDVFAYEAVAAPNK
jgi:hypothetical protein